MDHIALFHLIIVMIFVKYSNYIALLLKQTPLGVLADEKVTLFNAQTIMAPPPTGPCFFISWEATRNRFLRHNNPEGGEAHVGM